MKLQYSHTRLACYGGYVTQAIVNNLPPLLFLTFQNMFAVTLGNITLLITMNFLVQLLVDLLAVGFVDKIGYRKSAVIAQVMSGAGLICLGMLPFALPNAYVGIVIAMVMSAIGGGLNEVIISPIIEALPGDAKAASMSLLHSFYCWGHVLVVLLSTVYFLTIGTLHWRWLPLLWALLPVANSFLFARVPLCTLPGAAGKQQPLKFLFTQKAFLLLFLLMVCAGAAEQAMSQWASFFAEQGLGVSKTMGDLLGPCLFAVLMGVSRLFFSRRGSGLHIENALTLSCVLCVGSYLLAAFSPWPVLSLMGCGLCGFSVGLLWPGTFSLAARRFPVGGTAMFAILALAGDLGCASGPALVGAISDGAQGRLAHLAGWLFPAQGQAALKLGLLCAAIFPVLLVGAICLLQRLGKHNGEDGKKEQE